MGKSKQWVTDDEVKLCQAYLAATANGITGTDQSFAVYSKQIYAEYLGRHPAEERNETGCNTRWSSIKKDVHKFVGCFAKATSQEISGYNDEAYMTLAKSNYTAMDCSKGKSFMRENCWRVLKDHPKFLHASKTKKLVRPSDGKKKQKEGMKRKALDESSHLDNASRLVKSREERNKLMAQLLEQQQVRHQESASSKRADARDKRVTTLERIMNIAASSSNPQIIAEANEVRDMELASMVAEIKAENLVGTVDDTQNHEERVVATTYENEETIVHAPSIPLLSSDEDEETFDHQ